MIPTWTQKANALISGNMNDGTACIMASCKFSVVVLAIPNCGGWMVFHFYVRVARAPHAFKYIETNKNI